jgi:hypothetical protein
VLVTHNQLIQQPGFLVFQSLGNRKAFLPRHFVVCHSNCFSEKGPHRSDGHRIQLDDKTQLQD